MSHPCLSVTDNPPDPTEIYPGLFSRNNPGGSLKNRDEFILQKTREWYSYVKDNPKYSISWRSDNVAALRKYLMKFKVYSTKSKKLNNAACSKLLELVESANKTKEHYPNIASQVMEVDDKMKGDTDDSKDDDSNENVRYGEGRTSYEKSLADILKRSDRELFESGLKIEEDLKFSPKYKSRRENYSIKYFESNFDNTSLEEIIKASQNIPDAVKESKFYDSLVSDVSKQDKCSVVAMDSVKETLRLLSKHPSPETKLQRKIIIASLTSLEYGAPATLGINRREEQDAKEMKLRLLTNKSSLLDLHPHTSRKVFPTEINELAVEHWKRITIIDPSKQNKPRKALKDDEETLPIRWQTTTNVEAYESFQEMYSEDIREIMTRHARKYKENFLHRPPSADRTYRLKYVEEIPNRFPGFTWYMERKPPEVKLMNDYSTGHCKVLNIIKF